MMRNRNQEPGFRSSEVQEFQGECRRAKVGLIILAPEF
jgi:hypothetical protein